MGIGIFSPLSPSDREAHRSAYRDYLANRDGAADVAGRTLARREETLQRFLGPPIVERSDKALFESQYRRFDSSRATPSEMLLLLAFVKLNAAEAYGVEKSFAAAVARAEADNDDLEVVVMLEEHYHTQILLSTATLFGFAIERPFSPPPQLKALILALATMPKTLARPLILASEIAGVIAFSRLLEKTHTLLAKMPVLRDAMEERLTEVLIDEIGHVSFNRLCLGRAGLAQTRAALPLVAFGTRDILDETRVLEVASVSASDMADFTFRSLPEEVRRKSFLA